MAIVFRLFSVILLALNMVCQADQNFPEASLRGKELQSRTLDGSFEFFYLYHAPEVVIDLIERTAMLEEFNLRIYFYEALFKTYPEQALHWMQAAKVRIEDHKPLIRALWRSGLQVEAIYRAQKAAWPVKNLLELMDNPKPVLELPVTLDGYLCCMSSYFFVTGDTTYVNKIIDTLDLTQEKVPSSFNVNELKKEAKRYLTLLMFHHELAYQQCLKESQSRSGEAHRLLEELLEKHKTYVKRGSLPEHNGMLNGDILITDSSTIEEEWVTLPIDSGPIGKPITSVSGTRDGKLIKIIPFFSGFALDPELNGYVTFDVDIYDPEGKKICADKEQRGLQRKIPSRFLVQAADDSMGLRDYCFKTGIYKIEVVIRDHIGKKELKITKTLEALP